MRSDQQRSERPWPRNAGPGRNDAGDATPPTDRARHLDLDALNAVVNGDLASRDQAAAAAHLAVCADCRADLAELRATVALLGGLPQYAPRRSFQLGPEHARQRAEQGDWFTRLFGLLPALRLASVATAALLVLATVGGLVADRTAPSASVDSPAVMAPRAVVPDIDAPSAGAPDAESDLAPAFEPLAPAAEAPAAEDTAEEAPAPVAQAPAPAPRTRQAVDDADEESSSALAPNRTEVDGTESASEASQPMQDVPAPTAAAGGEPAAGTAPDEAAQPGVVADGERPRPTVWRLAQVGLALALLWLLVGLVGLSTLQRSRRGS